jgi:asparagine synthase (glutamine-hydrolysing)
VHREICRKYLPEQILRRKKRGFAVNVVDRWYQTSGKGPLTDLLLDNDSLLFRMLKPGPVRKLLEDHRVARQDNHKLLFSLVMLEQWLRVSTSNGPAPASTVEMSCVNLT